MARRTSARMRSSSSAEGSRRSAFITAPRMLPCPMSSATFGPVPADSSAFALRGEIDRSAAVRIDDERGDALRHDRLRLPQLGAGETLARVRVHVDEARRDVAVAGVDHRCRVRVREHAHRRDAAAADAEVRAHPWIAGAVEDTAVANHDVESRRLRLSRKARKRRKDKHPHWVAHDTDSTRRAGTACASSLELSAARVAAT